MVHQQPPLEGMPEVPHIDKRMSFSGVVSEMGRNMDIPRFEQLDGRAVSLAEPHELHRRLYGLSGGTAVKGLVISAEEYGLMVRSPDGFQTAIQAKTVAANRHNKLPRARQKAANASQSAFGQKIDRYDGLLSTLGDEQAVLKQLMDWQSPYGYAHTTKADILAKANHAWNYSFRNILDVIRDQHNLSTADHQNLTNAVSYKLFRGPQSEKMKYWGGMLHLAHEYSRNKAILFRQSQRELDQRRGALALQQTALTSDSDEF